MIETAKLSRVVAPGALAVHADRDLQAAERAGKCSTSELAALVGVEDLRLAEPRQRFFERFDAERRFHRDRQPPRQHTAAEPVDHRRQIHEAARDLVRVHVEMLRQLRQRQFPFNCRQRHLRLECRCVIPARSSGRLLLLSCGHPGRRQAETPLIPLSRFPEPALLMALAGHSNMATTQRYIDLRPAMLKAAVELV